MAALGRIQVEKFAPGAPQTIKDQAVLMLEDYLAKSYGLNPRGRLAPPNAMVKSGAAGILWQWKKPTFSGQGEVVRPADDTVFTPSELSQLFTRDVVLDMNEFAVLTDVVIPENTLDIRLSVRAGEGFLWTPEYVIAYSDWEPFAEAAPGDSLNGNSVELAPPGLLYRTWQIGKGTGNVIAVGLRWLANIGPFQTIDFAFHSFNRVHIMYRVDPNA